MLNGKYVTLRSAGNYLAGLNAATVKLNISTAESWYVTSAKKAGELHMKHHDLTEAPYPAYNFGEIEYTARMFYAGFTQLYKLPSRQQIYVNEELRKKDK